MPRISAASVADHVAQQEAAVVRASVRLFTERGYHEVSLGDIAAEVGLARSSLYRYVPDKGHLLGIWFRTAIEPLLDACRAIADDDGDPGDRLAAWVSLQFDYLAEPEHQAMVTAATSEAASLPDDVRAEIGAGHRELEATLTRIVAEHLGPADAARAPLVASFVGALVVHAARTAAAGADDTDAAATRAELLRAAQVLCRMGPQRMR